MEINNEHPKEDSTNSVDSSQPFYAEIAKIDDLVSLATDKEIASNSQCVNNKVPALNKVPKLHSKGKGKWIKSSKPISSEHISNNVYNMQIPYNINQAVNLKS